MDLFFLSPYKKANSNLSIFMIIIDILSRKLFIYPMKNKTQDTIVDMLSKFFKRLKGDVLGLSGDDSKVAAWCAQNKVRLSTDVATEDHISKGNKLGIVDRATRTIKTYIRNYMLANDTTKFVDVLPDLVDNYNTTPHSSLGNSTPSQIFGDLDRQREMYNELTQHNDALEQTIDLSEGDYVRKRTDRGRFDKETATFSSDIYVIEGIEGRKYVIVGADGKTIAHRYKYHELMRVDPKVVEGRLQGTSKAQAEVKHKQVRKVRKELGKTHEEAEKEIEKVTQPDKVTPPKQKKSKKKKVEVIAGETHVEVESFLAQKYAKGTLLYLVKWRDEPAENNLWLPAKQLAEDLSPDAFAALKRGLKAAKTKK
ncbi:hypothetical protein TSOC_004210 [Tetrabaena socialis]|uniref:Chromo domain-containing protein n=1 Tax=Tetrabaena socialis TaxID=47790 RepID=A0A2J8A9I9_9CHLO|nr:hypothetical protein TSOC_004210 [Tetrabaena socialis]|eukprot:PNH09165.1 hypothetical protein TSOC_004210 [Tetrabaena socialis]